MDKKKVVAQILEYLEQELVSVTQAAKASHEAATHDESRAEDAHDTRAIEAGYLAGAQLKRVEEIKALLVMYKFMPLRDFSGPGEVVCPSALVELEFNKTRAFYFVAPQGGGLVTRVDGFPVQVITPASPIGEELLGKRVGDLVEVEMRGATREYKVIGIQ